MTNEELQEDGQLSAGQLVDEWMRLKNSWGETKELVSRIEETMDDIANQLSSEYGMSMPLFGQRSNFTPPPTAESSDESPPPRQVRSVESVSPAVGSEEVSYIPPAQGPVSNTAPIVDPTAAAARNNAGVVADDAESGQGFLQSIMGSLNSIQGGLR